MATNGTTTASSQPQATPRKMTIAEQKGAIIAQVERLSAAVIKVINAGDFDFHSTAAQEVEAHVSPHWFGVIDTQPSRVTWAEQKAMWKARSHHSPDVFFDIKSMLTDVDVKRGVATVHMIMDVDGIDNVRLQAINDMTWMREGEDGRWMCVSTFGMRGTPCGDGL